MKVGEGDTVNCEIVVVVFVDVVDGVVVVGVVVVVDDDDDDDDVWFDLWYVANLPKDMLMRLCHTVV